MPADPGFLVFWVGSDADSDADPAVQLMALVGGSAGEPGQFVQDTCQLGRVVTNRGLVIALMLHAEQLTNRILRQLTASDRLG